MHLHRAYQLISLLRLLLGIIIAGMWPGMAYYLTLFYPPSRTGKRIGQYFTAAQVSAAVVGLVSAGFQEMDGLGGLVGFQWMFLLYGLVGIIVGFSLLWWLPDRPLPPGQVREHVGWKQWIPQTKPALTGMDAEIHYRDLTRVYHPRAWTIKDLWHVLIDWRLWPLVMMYFGVVGVGIGVQNYGTVIIEGINPNLTGVQLSLLFAPIWVVSVISVPSGIAKLIEPARWILLPSSLSLPFPIAFTSAVLCSSAFQCAFKSVAFSSLHTQVALPTPGLVMVVSLL